MRLLELIGLKGDERFSSFQARSRNREALEDHMRAWIAARPVDAVVSEFRRVDAAIAKVYDMKDIFADPHFKARDMITEVDGVVMQNVVANFSKTPGRLRHAGQAVRGGQRECAGGGAGGRARAERGRPPFTHGAASPTSSCVRMRRRAECLMRL